MKLSHLSRGKIIMKKSIFTISLIALAISTLSLSVQSEEKKRPNLSITSISGAQMDSMRSQSVSKGSILSTTVTMGGKNVQSEHQTTYLKTNNQARQKWLAKKANIVIKQAMAHYAVRKGDTLSKIAQRYGTTIERIMQINKLKSTTILVGQLLKV